ncbi:MAG: hypothetical protein B6244_13610, partial [Candidatus Cloacimonetes bacterium 4572_55]
VITYKILIRIQPFYPQIDIAGNHVLRLAILLDLTDLKSGQQGGYLESERRRCSNDAKTV